ncbi:MAG: hypothetical protein B6244_12955 [Candidatus Cloacimonetes bacterium 4572_55]|nr:MAG: hypothetical protein B6244_12955 [Candidatus Cloacimonetes bacterium 4572_55]
MKLMKLKYFILITMISLFSYSFSEANSGTATVTFMKIGSGARPVALGEAFVAVPDGGAIGLYWNPASASFGQGTQAAFNYTDWIMDTSHNYFGGVTRYGEFGFGVNVIYFDGGEFESRGDNPTQEPDGFFSANELALGFTISRRLADDLSLGVTGKYLYSKIETEEARGVAMDFGIIYQPRVIENLTLGFSISNIGQKMKYVEEKFNMPTITRAGFSYPLNHFARIAIDMNKASDSDLRLQTGVELNIKDILSLRTGYKFNYDTDDFAAGMGVSIRNYQVDYAFLPRSDELDDAHYITVGLNF